MLAAVIEDQTLMRDYLVRLLQERLGATLVVAIGSMAELRRREPELAGARLILFDVDLGDGVATDWAIQRFQREPAGRLVALSSITGAHVFKQLQLAGISLVHKNDTQAELTEALRLVLGGSTIVSRRMQELLAAGARDPKAPFKILGPREQQVLALLGQRLRNEEIAGILGCSESTVADHRKRIMQKLSLHHIEEVIDYAIKHGVIYAPPAGHASGANDGA